MSVASIVSFARGWLVGAPSPVRARLAWRISSACWASHVAEPASRAAKLGHLYNHVNGGPLLDEWSLGVGIVTVVGGQVHLFNSIPNGLIHFFGTYHK